MKKLLFLILTLFSALSINAQFRMVGTASWTTINDSTYTSSISFQSDLTGMGYLATQIVDTFRLFTPTEKIYRVDSVWNKTFSSADIRVVEYLGTQGVPVGQVMVFNPDGRTTIPNIPFGSTGGTAQMNAAIDAWNARQISTAGSVDTIPKEIYWDFAMTVDTLTTSPGYANMDGAESFYTFSGDTLIQVGGWKGPGQSHNEQWYSLDDGVTWTQADTAEWSDSHTFGFIEKASYFYKIGSDVFDISHMDEVWKSSDGLNWTLVTNTAEWGNRALFGTALRNDTMFVFGGQDTICNAIIYDDVWYSVNDGANWTQLCDNCVPEGGGHVWRNIAEYDNKFWLVAGELYDDCIGRVRHKKVYNSIDGINWIYLDTLPISTLTDSGITYSRTFVWNGFLWFYSGGYSSGPAVQSRYLLFTRDGVTWYDKTLSQLPATHAPALAVKDENTFLVTSGGGSTMFNDVFRVDANRVIVRKLQGSEVSRDTLNDEKDGIYQRSATILSSIVASVTDSVSIGELKVKTDGTVSIGDNLSDSYREILKINGSIILNQSSNNAVLYLNKNLSSYLFNSIGGVEIGFPNVTNATENWFTTRHAGADNRIWLGNTGTKGIISTVNTKMHIGAFTSLAGRINSIPAIAIALGNAGVGILDSIPATTAALSIAAGTTLKAPLKFATGINLTTPVAGHVEWDGSRLYITQTTGPTRKTIAYTDDIGTGIGNGIFDAANNNAAIAIDGATYADDLVLTGGGGTAVTRLAADMDESYLFTLVNKNAIFLDSNTVYLGLDDGTRGYLEIEGLEGTYEGSTFSFGNKTAQPVPTIRYMDLDQSNFYGFKAADVTTASYTEIHPTAGPGSNDMVKLHDTDGTTTFGSITTVAGTTNTSDGLWTPAITMTGTDTVLNVYTGRYQRQDSTVFFSFAVNVGLSTSTGAGTFGFTASLPYGITSNFTDANNDVTGTMTYTNTGGSIGLVTIAALGLSADTGSDLISCGGYIGELSDIAGAVQTSPKSFTYPTNRYKFHISGSFVVK